MSAIYNNYIYLPSEKENDIYDYAVRSKCEKCSQSINDIICIKCTQFIINTYNISLWHFQMIRQLKLRMRKICIQCKCSLASPDGVWCANCTPDKFSRMDTEDIKLDEKIGFDCAMIAWRYAHNTEWRKVMFGLRIKQHGKKPCVGCCKDVVIDEYCEDCTRRLYEDINGGDSDDD